MKLISQPSYQIYLALKAKFTALRPVFSDMEGIAEYTLAKKYYDKLSLVNLSTVDFDHHCSLLARILVTINKDANPTINKELLDITDLL